MADVPDRFSRVADHIDPEGQELYDAMCEGSVLPVSDRRPTLHPVSPVRPPSETRVRALSGVRDDALTPEGQAKIVETLSRRTLSDRALELIDGDRQEVHGPPEDNLRAIGQVWAAVLQLPEPIPPMTVALMMCGLKIVRATQGDGSLEHLCDLVGYAELADRVRPLPMTSTGTGWFDGALVGGSHADTQETPENRS